MKPATLLTITLSHFCEKARWALDHTQLPYVEKRQAPGFHLVAVRRAGGRHATPALVTDRGLIEDSTAILQWADERAAPARKLYPRDPAARAYTLALEEDFDQHLGPHVRRALYHALLPSRRHILPLMGHQVPLTQRLLLPLVYGPLSRLMRSSMRIDAAGAERSRLQVLAVFDRVATLLADGRPYLTGDRFGAADLTFAALAAPLVCPSGYGVPLPSPEQLPEAAASLVRAARETEAGAFCLRMYGEHRQAGSGGEGRGL